MAGVFGAIAPNQAHQRSARPQRRALAPEGPAIPEGPGQPQPNGKSGEQPDPRLSFEIGVAEQLSYDDAGFTGPRWHSIDTALLRAVTATTPRS